MCSVCCSVLFFFSSRRRHTRCALVMEFRRVLFRSFPFVPRADRSEAAGEVALASLLHSQDLKIAEQACRSVIAGSIAAFDFILDLTPYRGAPLLERSEPGAALLSSLLRLAAALRLTALGVGAPTRLGDLPGSCPRGDGGQRRQSWRRAPSTKSARESGDHSQQESRVGK